jgi:hypothetical protein
MIVHRHPQLDVIKGIYIFNIHDWHRCIDYGVQYTYWSMS